jgi:hypothetical protein
MASTNPEQRHRPLSNKNVFLAVSVFEKCQIMASKMPKISGLQAKILE